MWGLFDENIPLERVEAAVEVICFAAKWLGEKRTTFYSVHKHGKDEMVQAAHRLLDEADVVMHYNGKRFDIPHLNREFVQAGMSPPSPYQQIDLYQVVKSRFRFDSNKLAFVAPALGLQGKVKHSGFELWRRCLADDPKAWREMEKYNRRDVDLLEELYERVLPWIPNHPNRALIDGVVGGCPLCASQRLQRRGTYKTKVSTFVRLHCQDCGGYSRLSSRVSGVSVQQVAG